MGALDREEIPQPDWLFSLKFNLIGGRAAVHGPSHNRCVGRQQISVINIS